MSRISSYCNTLHCDFFKLPFAPHLLMIVRDADDVVRAKELPVWPLDRAASCLDFWRVERAGQSSVGSRARLDAAHHGPVLGAMMILPAATADTHDPLHRVAVVAIGTAKAAVALPTQTRSRSSRPKQRPDPVIHRIGKTVAQI
jgi:hypothetical protein